MIKQKQQAAPTPGADAANQEPVVIQAPEKITEITELPTIINLPVDAGVPDIVQAYKDALVVRERCRFIIQAKFLKESISKFAKIICKNPGLPVIQGVLMNVADGALKLSGTDLENSLIITLPCETKGVGRACIDYKLLQNYLSGASDGSLLIEFAEAENEVLITRDGSVAKFAGLDSADFPDILDSLSSEQIAKIPCKYFVDGIIHAVPFVSGDALRPAITGVCVEFEKEVIRFISTDAHRMAFYTLKKLSTDYEFTGDEKVTEILPKKSCEILKGILKNETGTLQISKIAGSTNAFTYQNIKLICYCLSAEKYPDFRAIVPTKFENVLKINRKELLGAINRLMPVADPATNQISIFLNGACELKAENFETGYESTEKIRDFSYKGADLIFVLNGKLWKELICSMGAERVCIMGNEPDKAFIVLPMEINRQNDFMGLIMPVLMPKQAEDGENPSEEAEEIGDAQETEAVVN